MEELRTKNYNKTVGTYVERNVYNLIIGLTLIWGVAINILMSIFLKEQILSINYLVVLAVYLIGSIVCILIVNKSDNPAISFLGYTGLSTSMGLLITYYVSFFEVGDVMQAFITTGIVVLIMTTLGSLYPKFFISIIHVLSIAFFSIFIIEVISILFFGIHPSIFDWIFCFIFCGYIGYDWAKSQQYYSSVDNAIDSAADIYIDVINLFVRILSIIGRRD